MNGTDRFGPDVQVDDLLLSDELKMIFRREKIERVGQLVQLTERKLTKIMGRRLLYNLKVQARLIGLPVDTQRDNGLEEQYPLPQHLR